MTVSALEETADTSMRILIVCEHASARFGGEAILPLHWFKYLRQAGDEVWLVSHARTREEVVKLFPDCKDYLHFAEDTPWQQRLHRIRSRVSARIARIVLDLWVHFITQLRQRRLVRGLVRAHSIDWVFEPMPVSPRQPSLMSDVGAPVVIGPMNGGMSYPPGFRAMDRCTDRLMIPLARAFAALSHFVLPGKRKAEMLLVANKRTRKALPWSVRHVPVLELVENGIDTSRWRAGAREMSASHTDKKDFSFAYVGRLVDWKAVDILIDAFFDIRREADFSLHVFGDGPEREKLQDRVQRSGSGRKVHFHGFVPQEDLPEKLSQCNCLVLPSLYECGGAVVLEAMSLGLPVIATNWGGPADYLDSSCGFLVEPKNREEFRKGLKTAMERFLDNPDLARQLGAGGLQRVSTVFTWEQKVDQLRGILLGRSRNTVKQFKP
jgi:glycosyltransferase involved in cell wall biosynthesis